DRTDDSTRWLIDDPARNLEEAHVPEGSDQAVVVEIKKAGRRCSLVDLPSGKEVAVPRVTGNLVPLAPVSDKDWIGLYYKSTQPYDLVRFPVSAPDPATFVSITQIWKRTSLKQSDLAAAEDFDWKSVDGLDVHGWWYQAPNPKGTVVFIHGGPTGHSE